MIRNTVRYIEDGEGRDKGKLFIISEMSSSQGERLTRRVLSSMLESGVYIPQGVPLTSSLFAQIAISNIGKIRWDNIELIASELWGCVQYIPTPSKPDIIRLPYEDDIEEIITIHKLRWEAAKLNFGHFFTELLSLLKRYREQIPT